MITRWVGALLLAVFVAGVCIELRSLEQRVEQLEQVVNPQPLDHVQGVGAGIENGRGE